MKNVPSVKLSEFFSLIRKPTYVVGTTYSMSLAFFESVVFPHINRSQLRGCVILCDQIGYARAISEGPALLGAGQDYVVMPAPVADSFHAKVWLALGEGEAALLVGSGNLTQSGFMDNAEVFDIVHITHDHPASEGFISELVAFLDGIARMWKGEDTSDVLGVELLAKMSSFVKGLPSAQRVDGYPRFVHSFSGTILEQLPDAPLTELRVASPFFGGSLSGLGKLVSRFGTASVVVFPAIHEGDKLDLPLSRLRAELPKIHVSRLITPSNKRGAYAHLKLYGGSMDDDRAWIFTSSANCTDAALQGGNVEAGILRDVATKDMLSYFVAAPGELPSQPLKHEQSEGTDGSPLAVWAVDDGVSLEATVYRNAAHHLPLKEVRVTIRAGCNQSVVNIDAGFVDGRVLRLPWSAFQGWKTQGKAAICLELRGLNCNGKTVRGTCFVENRAVLSADPIHRRAFLGVLSLLSEDGAPQAYDIAALFTLAWDAFDGRLGRPSLQSGSISSLEKSKEGSVEDSTALAVWPPQPDISELRKRLGSTASGQLHWFQRILRQLLTTTKGDEEGVESQPLLTDEADEEAGQLSDKATARNEESKKVLRSAAQRLWGAAEADFQKLLSRLRQLAPTEEQGPNIMPAAILVFLATMASFRTARRMDPDANFGSNAEHMAHDFLSVMLRDRRQSDDFCCPKNFPYRSEIFPPLVDDLRDRLGAKLHRDFAEVFLAIIAAEKQRTAPNDEFPGQWRRYLESVCEPEFEPDESTRIACLRIWRTYLRTDDSTSEGNFLKAYESLWRFRHPRPA